ncbi:hypothetical protein MUG78_12595 [Gordonia alkaliphila]|uniref:hypothetical protein n=1 Tax=Gordonia alkaliphila TaxID=1053547 RepID=UPI001FF381E0|nr:hypothetical protein [Gordonia alkaliphila]MCK0440265.1 hypothetical protein [Gordonia alkaliphila]
MHTGSTSETRPAATTGLAPTAIQTWQTTIGAEHPLGADPTRYLHRVGQQGLDSQMETFAVTADDPAGFEEYLYWRPLTHLMAFSLLRTPCTTARTPEG